MFLGVRLGTFGLAWRSTKLKTKCLGPLSGHFSGKFLGGKHGGNGIFG